jgi:hypothetical protein
LRKTAAEVVRLDSQVTETPEPIERNPLYGVAMLKIAMELKRQDTAALEEILTGVLAKMHLPEAEFRAFLTENGGLLRSIAQRRKY